MSISEFNNGSTHPSNRQPLRDNRRDPIQHPGRHIQRRRPTDTTECSNPLPHGSRAHTTVFAPHAFQEPLSHPPTTIDGIVEIKKPLPDSIGISLTEHRAPPPCRIMRRTIRARQRRHQCIQECGPVGIGRWGERSEPMEYKPHGRSPNGRIHNSHSIKHPCGCTTDRYTRRCRRP